MRIDVTFRRIEATDALRAYAEKRIRRLAKYVRQPLSAHVILSVVKRRHIAEVIFKADRKTMTAKEETGDLYSAIDLVVDKLEQRARKHAEKTSFSKRAPRARRLGKRERRIAARHRRRRGRRDARAGSSSSRAVRPH